MVESLSIRSVQPTLDDTTVLLDVEHRSLGDSNYTPTEALDIVSRPEQRIYLATSGDEPLGFCACIETPTPLGAQLEVDMLGVVPNARHQGIGLALIRHGLEQARQRGIQRFRAVVAIDNIASLRAFERAGFAARQPQVMMLVYVIRGLFAVPFLPKGWHWELHHGTDPVDPADRSTDTLARGALSERHVLCDAQSAMRASAEGLVVQTLAYQGIWVEDLAYQNDTALRLMGRALCERAKVLDVDEVGYLSPQDSRTSERDAALKRIGFKEVGRYLILARQDTS